MEIEKAKGLFKNIAEALTEVEVAIINGAFSTLNIEQYGYKVFNPGTLIFNSYCEEKFGSEEYIKEFQNSFISLLRYIIDDKNDNNNPAQSYCCTYHENLLGEIRKTYEENNQWLLDFLLMLSPCTQKNHMLYISNIEHVEESPILLSRVMPLKNFIGVHTSLEWQDSLRQDFIKKLSPILSKKARRRFRETKQLGRWFGNVGTYPSPSMTRISDEVPYLKNCSAIKPFATLNELISESFDRKIHNPDRLLQKLGLTFKADEHWIELIYSSEKACIRLSDKTPHLVIPTRLESFGNWAFWPDRDDLVETNFALDISKRKRGLPEIIHNIIDIYSLDDAIVWTLPTEYDWIEKENKLMH